MANIEKINENLENLLTTEKYGIIKERLVPFHKDEWLMGQVQSLSDNLSKDNLIALADTLHETVLVEYPKNIDPTIFHHIYKVGLSRKGDHLKSLGGIFNHIFELNGIEPTIVLNGLTERSEGSSRDSAPYGYDDQSYLSMIYDMYTGIQQNIKPGLENAQSMMNVFKSHYEDLKKAEIDINRIVSKGYNKLLRAVYNKSNKDNNYIKSQLEGLKTVMLNLEKKGFNVYSSNSLNTFKDFIDMGKLDDLEKMTEFYNSNVLILNLGIRLKNN